MKWVEKVIMLPASTMHALEDLSVITGAEKGVGEVIRDALRVYEWIIYYQQKDHKVVPLTPEELQKLNLSPDREALANLIEPNAKEKAKEYFTAVDHQT